LIKYNLNKQISISHQNLNQTKENLVEFENKYNNIKQDLIQLCYLNEEIKKQIEESERKNEINKNQYEYQIQEQRERNRALQNAINDLQENS
jgi:arginine deiminase